MRVQSSLLMCEIYESLLMFSIVLEEQCKSKDPVFVLEVAICESVTEGCFSLLVTFCLPDMDNFSEDSTIFSPNC